MRGGPAPEVQGLLDKCRHKRLELVADFYIYRYVYVAEIKR